jgi:regulator of protease activity HflC (stomatin/prohibitin superfamily)
LFTILFIVGALAAAIGLLWTFIGKERKGAGVGALIGGLIVVALCSFSTVDARSVGIQTSFGKYRDTLPAGIHLTAPWSSVEDWTTRNQTIRFEGDGKAEERDNFFTEPRITVRLGNQSEAYVDVTVTWGITEKSVESLWRQYKTFGDARRDFVTPQALGAANTAFDGYDPFSGLDEKNADNPYVPLSVWSQKITDALRPSYTSRNVELISVQVTKVTYDQKTEEKLRQYSDAVANTRIKAQDVKTAEQEAAASKARAQTAAPGCEALIRDLAAADKLKDLPAGWQCPGNPGPSVVSSK